MCEGYSKAFKYLFDLYAAKHSLGSSYDCILVTGDMSGGTGAGPHMWNIVRLDDGKNYLVDVTNCDEGTIGAPDKLFMVSQAEGTWYSYSITVNGKLDVEHAFSIDGYTIRTSVIGYAGSMLTTDSADMQYLRKALYLYNAAANAYFRQ